MLLNLIECHNGLTTVTSLLTCSVEKSALMSCPRQAMPFMRQKFAAIGIDSSVFSSEYAVFPGFCDVHVHFREPGFSYK